MPTDIVLDTNVLLHADNEQETRQEHSVRLINYLLNSDIQIRVDEGFDLNEASNRSKIGSEYLGFLRFGMLGYDFITKMANSGRVNPLSRNVSTQVARKLNICVTDKTDRIFARVTFNSQDKILISHNLNDLPPVCLGRNLSLQVLEASSYMIGK